MENFFGQLYLDLCERIKTQVPEIRWIDQDFGQLEHFEYRPDVSFPCVLIDLQSASYSNMAELSQIGEVAVMLRLGFAPFSKSHHSAPMDVKEKALEFYTIEQKLFEAVHGWQNEHCQPLIRLAVNTEQRDNDAAALRVRVMTFSTNYEDESMLPKYTRHAATATIELDD